jgi:hypothetical protein
MEALSQLASGISHGFNNMLQAVTGGLTAPTRDDHSVPVKALAASKTAALRSSCRLRSRSRLLTWESGVALAQRPFAC